MTYVKSMHCSAVINTDDSYYNSLLTQRQVDKQANHLQRQIDALSKEMNDIKTLLIQIIDGINNGQNGS